MRTRIASVIRRMARKKVLVTLEILKQVADEAA